MAGEVIFSREDSIAESIERYIRDTRKSIRAALYRFDNQRLAETLQEAADHGISVKLILDHNKFDENKSIQKLVEKVSFHVRLAYGRTGRGSKMHHKFAIFDSQRVLLGSYNWAVDSETQNYENLLIVDDPKQVELYDQEFELLWSQGAEVTVGGASAGGTRFSESTS